MFKPGTELKIWATDLSERNISKMANVRRFKNFGPRVANSIGRGQMLVLMAEIPF